MANLVGSSAVFHTPMSHRLLITALIFFANVAFAEEIFLNVNVKKPLAVTSDKFLSYTLDPEVVLTGNALTSNPEKSVNMGRALSPAYVRIAGPRSNSYTFVRSHHPRNEEDPNFVITETNWIDVHRWANNASLDIVACIAAQHIETRGGDSVWDSRNALDLVSFSDEMRFNTSWQLGYECQTRCDGTGIDIGRAVTRLRSMLDAFPRYSESFITGPDVVTYRTRQQQQYLQDYFNVGGNALSAITWHPNFADVTLDSEGVSIHHDNLEIDRDVIYRLIGRSVWKKPLWLAESKPEECKRQFLGALVWTKRLGNAAKLGVQVIMRQPDDSDLLRPSPDYWVSVLHKTLVGREVLDTRITNGNRTHVDFYCHCTRPSSKYEKGSLTIFGTNLTPTKISVALRGLKITTIHKYILLPGNDAENRMFSETVLLNDEPLNLINDKEVPPIRPAVLINNSKGVALNLPSGGIGFWVLPDVKIRTCGGLEEDNGEKTLTKKSSKRFEEADFNDDMASNDESERVKNNEESSTEERRRSSKSSRSKRQRKAYQSEEEDNDRRQRRFEAKNDFERLEKLLRRRDWYVDRRSSSGKRTVRFNFNDNDGGKPTDHDDLDDDGAIIKIRDLEEYRKRLNSRSSAEVIDKTSNHGPIDGAKFIEAIELLLKLENPFKKFERSKINDTTRFDEKGINFTSEFADSGNDTRDDHRHFDKSTKSDNFFERIKDIPSTIEDQLRLIYRILNDKRNDAGQRDDRKVRGIFERKVGVERSAMNNIGKRSTRGDNDSKFDGDFFGLQKEPKFNQAGRFIEEMRERRYRRRAKSYSDEGRPFAFSSRFNLDNRKNHSQGLNKRESTRNFDSFDTDSGRDERLKVSPDNDGDKSIKAGKPPTRYMPVEFIETFEKIQVPGGEKPFKECELSEAELFNQRGNLRSNIEKIEAATLATPIEGNRNDRAKNAEVKVKKTIGFNEDPRGMEDESDLSDETKRTEKTGNGLKYAVKISTSDDRRMDETALHGIKKKGRLTLNHGDMEDFPFGENVHSAGFTSVRFNRPTAPSTKPATTGSPDVTYRIIDMSGDRTKRSTENRLENTLEREMMFPVAANLEVRNCRATRSKRTVRAHDKRDNRRINPSRSKRLEARNNRRMSRKRNNSTTLKSVADPTEMTTVATRPKRNAELPSEERTDLPEGGEELFGGNWTESESTAMKSTESDKTENSSREMENSTKNHTTASDETNSPYEDTTIDVTRDSSSLELERNGGVTESSLTLNEDPMDIAIESETIGFNNVVKRQNEGTTLKNNLALGDETEVTERPPEIVGTVRSAMMKDFTEAVEEKSSEMDETARTKVPRGRKSKKETTEKPKRSRRINPTNTSGFTVLPSFQISQTSSIIDNTSVESITVTTIATNEASSFNATNFDAEGSTKRSNEENSLNAETSTMNEKGEGADRGLPKIDVQTMGNVTAMIKKRSQRMRKAPKVSNSVRLRGIQKGTLPSTGLVGTEDNDAEIAKKSRRNEQPEKLRKKLAPKREKRLNDHEDTSDEFAGVNEKIRRLKRREIVGMIMNDENFRDLVDGEKLEYVNRNRPTDYEAAEDSSGLEYAEDAGEKYVAEIIDIVRPPHVTRERKIKSHNSNVRTDMNARLSISDAPKAASENTRRRDDDPVDHLINAPRDAKYYGVLKSFENPKISEQSSSYENSPHEETRVNVKSSIESDEYPTRSSPEYNNRKLAFDKDEGKGGRLDHPEEESIRIRKMFPDLTTFVKSATFSRENGEKDFSENTGEFSKSVEENENTKAMPIDNLRLARNNHSSKKRTLKNSDYETDEKYDSPRYERLARDDFKHHRSSRIVDSEETFRRIGSKKSMIDRRARDDFAEENPAIIDHTNLDEALKSGNYELLLLIPATKNQMSRRKRHVDDDEASRHERNLITNEGTLKMAQKKNMLKTPEDKMEESRLDDERLINNVNRANSLLKPSLNTSIDKNLDDNFMKESSTVVAVEPSKNLDKNNSEILNDNTIEETNCNDRKYFSKCREEFMDDQSLPDLLEGTIPKLEATVTGGLGKIRRISESFEKFIDEFDADDDGTEMKPPMKNNEENDMSMSDKIFRNASTSVKRFFDFISGLLHIFRQN